MVKAVAIYAIIATALVFILILPTSHHLQRRRSHHICLSRRFAGSKGPHFDPFLTRLKQKAEEKALTNHNLEDHYDALLPHNDVHLGDDMVEAEVEEEDNVYFGDDGKLNLTLRLTILFPMIDRLPRDGHVGFMELEAWNIMQAKERLAYTTRREFEAHDKNNDGLISFFEYLPQFSDEDIKKHQIEKNKMEHGEVGWWMEQFTNADADADGYLSFEELGDFLHPEDSTSNAKVQEWLLREKIRRMDFDNDGKLNFHEFRDNAYDTFKRYYQFSTGEDYVPSPELQYANLDINNDRFLTIEELKPIRHFLFPGELDYASYYTTYLMNEVDDNNDGKLTLDEILNHEDKFYKSVYVGDDEGDDDYHDEF